MEGEQKPDITSTTPVIPRKRNRLLLQKSGMKQGAMLQYLCKKPKVEVLDVVDLDNLPQQTPTTSIQQSNGQQDSDDDCMIVEEVSREKKIQRIQVIDLSSDDESSSSDTESETANGEVGLIHIPAATLRPPNVGLAAVQQTFDLTLQEDIEGHVQCNGPSQNVHLRKDGEISTNLEEGADRVCNSVIQQNLETLNSKNAEASVDLNLEESAVEERPLISKTPPLIIDLVDDEDEFIVPVTSSDATRQRKRCIEPEITVSIESDDEVSLPESEQQQQSPVPLSEAINNKTGELPENDAVSMYDNNATIREEVPEDTARNNEVSRFPVESSQPAAASHMLASEILNQLTELTSQFPNGCETQSSITQNNANEVGSANENRTEDRTPTKELEINVRNPSKKSVHRDENIIAYANSDDSEEYLSDISSNGKEQDNLKLLGDIEKSRTYSSPLRTTTNENSFNRLAPQKRVEKVQKVQYSVIRQQSPTAAEITQSTTEDEEENLEPVIINSFSISSVRQLQFSPENVTPPLLPIQTPLEGNGVQNEVTNAPQNTVNNIIGPSPQKKAATRHGNVSHVVSSESSNGKRTSSLLRMQTPVGGGVREESNNIARNNAVTNIPTLTQPSPQGRATIVTKQCEKGVNGFSSKNACAKRTPSVLRMQTSVVGNNVPDEDNNAATARNNQVINIRREPSPQKITTIRGRRVNDAVETSAKQRSPPQMKIDDLIKKNSFGKAAELILKEIKRTSQRPEEAHVACVTGYILMSNRVSKDVKQTVISIWEQILKVHPITSITARKYYSDIISKIEIPDEEKPDLRRDAPEGYSDFLILVVHAARNQTVYCQKDAPIFIFLQIVTSIFEQEYEKSFLAQNVKRSCPLIVEALCQDHRSNYNAHVQFLLKELFSLYQWADRFYSVLSWTSRLADHFSIFNKYSECTTMIVDMSQFFKHNDYSKWADIIRKMSRPFGKEVCLELLKDIIYSSNRFPRQELSQDAKDNDKRTLMRFLEGTARMIKVAADYEKDFSSAPPITTESRNRYGEKDLHVILKDHTRKHPILDDYLAQVRSGRKKIDINEKDNNGNTAFHDAADTACFTCIMHFQRHNSLVTDDRNLPNNLAANLMAKNSLGDTPLHLLAKSTKFATVELFTMFLSRKELLPYCSLIRNNNGQTPRDCVVEPAILPACDIPGLDLLAPTSRFAAMNNPRLLDLLKLWHELTSTP